MKLGKRNKTQKCVLRGSEFIILPGKVEWRLGRLLGTEEGKMMRSVLFE
jgi:hypothetical protein